MSLLGGLFRTVVNTALLPMDVMNEITSYGENHIKRRVNKIADSLDEIV